MSGADPQLPRRLAAILYADVAGYSRLTGDDEDATHLRLSQYLDLFSSSIEQHRGRVVHYAGDAVLAMFVSGTEALSCAAAVQRALKNRNAELPAARRVEFRIGVNLGDVIEDRDDIYGDGVNVAACLESLAEPGGICVSEAVRSSVGKRLALDFVYLGEQRMKNIAEPVRVYRAVLEPGTRGRAQRVSRRLAAAGAATLLAIAGAVLWWAPWSAREEPASIDRMAYPLPQAPSLAVLPFDNLSGDPAQEYFSDGLTENLITTLSQLSGVFVIARNSTFAYKDRPVKVQQVAEELGVRYVLEGSFQRAGDEIRVQAHFIDALSGRHLWAKRFDRRWVDVFALQDDLTGQIVDALAVKLTEEERTRLARRYTSDVAAYDFFLQGLSRFFRFTPEDNQQARELYQRAIDLDPTFARAHGTLAMTHFYDYRYNWSVDDAASVDLALRHARRAATLDPQLPQAHFVLGQILMLSGRDYDEVVRAGQRAIALDRNYADAHALLAASYEYTGRAAEALSAIATAMRLNPYPPSAYRVVRARALYFLGRYQEASAELQRAVDQNPNSLLAHVMLAAAHGQLGNQADAEWQASQILLLDPAFSVASWLPRELTVHEPYLETLVEGLRKAGLAE